MKKRNKQDYEYFKKRVARWRDYFGLLNWAVTTRFDVLAYDSMAEIDLNAGGRSASIVLNKLKPTYPKEENEYRICKAAFHEMVHLLLGDLADAAQKGVGPRAVRMEENFIRIMENTIHDDLLNYWELSRENERLKKRIKRLENKA